MRKKINAVYYGTLIQLSLGKKDKASVNAEDKVHVPDKKIDRINQRYASTWELIK